MARYHVDNRLGGSQQNISTTFKTAVAMFSSSNATCRGRCVGIAMALDGAPNATDCQVVYAVERMTAGGTGINVTPNPTDSADQAARTTTQVNFSSEPTYTANTTHIFLRVLNQRASMQWNAQDTDAMLKWPTTVTNGLAIVALSPTVAVPVGIGAEFEE
jgi:hypothetical protein